MPYDLSKLPLQTLLRPLSDAASALARLDERIARSPVGSGFLERAHFADACASLWVDGELVSLEDLVLHDAAHDIRTPTHELTIAADVLKTRRRIVGQPAGWALSGAGLTSLCRAGAVEGTIDPASGPNGEGVAAAVAAKATAGGTKKASAVATEVEADLGQGEHVIDAADGNAMAVVSGNGNGEAGDTTDPLARELAAIDALLVRSESVIVAATAPVRDRERNPLVYEADWDEAARLSEWRTVLSEIQDLPPVLQAVIALDAWNSLAVLQHAPWLGRLLSAAILRQYGLSTSGHLVALNLGLKTVPVERRRHRDRNVRLGAILHGFITAAEQGLREHDRLSLARTMMQRRLVGRRTSSRLPGLIDLVIARPLVSADMVANALEVTPRAALRIVGELGLREMTGRGRFRVWGVM